MERLCSRLGYEFDDPELAERAITHRSAGKRNNERLEFLGDAILGFVIADELYRDQRRADEGQLSRLRSSLVRRETLAELARALDLGDYLVLGPGELRSGGQSRDSILADAMEALFAAIYLDGGYDAVRDVMRRLYADKLNEVSPAIQGKDPKTRLQEYLQGRGLNLPLYQVLDVTGEAHNQDFRVACRVEGLKIDATGKGSSRRRAEQAAAGQILETLGDA